MSFAVAWFYYLGYGPTLNPTSIHWLLRDDWSTYLWGFSFFRNAEWGFPLGSLPNLFYPQGTSVAFSDANPWFSVLFKLLSPLLPSDFQFCGIWFLLCYVLQAWFGTKIMSTMTSDGVQRALAGALFATSPVLPVRAAHVALSAIFFVTAGVWLNLTRSQDASAARRYARVSFALLIWAAGTHGYLTAMLFALCLAYYVRLALVDKLISLREGALFVAIALASVLATSYLFGYIGWKKSALTLQGFGLYSADLLALVNSQGISRYVPGLPCQPEQWEGYQYLGLGVLFLLAVGVVRALIEPRRTFRALAAHWPLLVVSLGMFVYACSSIVTYEGEPVVDLRAIYDQLWPLPAILRSSGRLGWPLHMTLIALAVAVVASMERLRMLARGLLLLGLFLESAEHNPLRLSFSYVPLQRLTHPAWSSAAHDYSHLELVPLHLQWDCRFKPLLVNTLSYHAYRHKFTFNSGNFMGKGLDSHKLCNKPVTTIDPRTLYVVDPDQLAQFRRPDVACGWLDGLRMCVTRSRATQIRAALLQTPIL